MRMDLTIDLYQENDIKHTRIENNTPYKIIISEKPIPPKRKPRDILIIESGGFMIMDGWDFDFEKVYISFKT